jgi:Mg/Co/Ni transporter MgtE
MLIVYPTEQEEKNRFLTVNNQDLEILQEIDKESQLDLICSVR